MTVAAMQRLVSSELLARDPCITGTWLGMRPLVFF